MFIKQTIPAFVRNVALLRRPHSFHSMRLLSAVAAAQPEPNVLSPGQADPKIQSIVDQISKLTLLEVAELNQTLKTTLNIPDAPVMAFAGGVAPASGGAAAKEEDDVDQKVVQTAFTLKITKFDDGKKVALIKEVKNLVEGLNLVQAKKFVESVPQVVKGNLSKDEAEKMKAALEAVGATCTID